MATSVDRLWYEGYAIASDGTIQRVELSDYVGDNINMHWKEINPIQAKICPRYFAPANGGSSAEVSSFMVAEIVNMRILSIYFWAVENQSGTVTCEALRLIPEEEIPFKPKYHEREDFQDLLSLFRGASSGFRQLGGTWHIHPKGCSLAYIPAHE